MYTETETQTRTQTHACPAEHRRIQTAPSRPASEALDTCVHRIIGKYDGMSDYLISILLDIQSEYHYVPEEALRLVAKGLGLPLIQVYGVATFFKALSLTPRGRHTVQVCMGTACHVRGAPAVLAELERQLGVRSGETTENRQFTLETVNCVGACALGPTVVVDDKYYGRMNPGKVKSMLGSHR